MADRRREKDDGRWAMGDRRWAVGDELLADGSKEQQNSGASSRKEVFASGSIVDLKPRVESAALGNKPTNQTN
jgi:hypothetical protein